MPCLDHLSKGQLSGLVARYFYSPGWRAIIDNVSDTCHQCVSLRKLPKVLIEDTYTIPGGVASKFAADIIERETQKILIIREVVSQYTRDLIIPDQKTDTLR